MGLLGQIIILVLVFGPRVIQSEVSQNERDKYYILVHACESRKVVQMNLFAGQEQRCRHGEQTYGRGSGGVNWESRTDIPTVPWVNQIASGNLLYNTESSLSSVLSGDLERGEGDPRRRGYVHTFG